MTRLEVRQQSFKEDLEINNDLYRIIQMSERWISKTDPYIAAVKAFAQDANGQASLNEAERDPAFQDLASESEKITELVISKFYKMICYGMLVRANEEALKLLTNDTDTVRLNDIQVAYAKINSVNSSTVRQRALRGAYHTALKIGRNWVIDKNEPHVDHRIKSGQYVRIRDES